MVYFFRGEGQFLNAFRLVSGDTVQTQYLAYRRNQTADNVFATARRQIGVIVVRVDGEQLFSLEPLRKQSAIPSLAAT